MRTVLITVCTFVVAAIISGCTSTPPAPVNVSGTWKYRYSSPQKEGIFKLTQKAGKISGTATDKEAAYKVDGYVSDRFIHLHGQCPKTGQVFHIIAKVNGYNDWMRGHFTTKNNTSGPFFARKQLP